MSYLSDDTDWFGYSNEDVYYVCLWYAYCVDSEHAQGVCFAIVSIFILEMRTCTCSYINYSYSYQQNEDYCMSRNKEVYE